MSQNRFGCVVLAVAMAAIGSSPACAPSGPAHDVELAALMLRMQVHTGKLHFALDGDNWPLADFYDHELHETYDEIFAARLTEDDVQISVELERFMKPALTQLGAAIDSKDAPAARAAYDRLVTGCNGCHTETKHDFIVVQTPTTSMWPNQVFTAK